MKPSILFIHQNFPAQFKHLAPELARLGYNVSALTMKKDQGEHWAGVRLFHYAPERSSTPNIHPWLIDFETKLIRGEAVQRAAVALRDKGYFPDIVIAHPGWGESLFVKDVWPDAKLGIYCEFFYNLEGADTNFDPEFPVTDLIGEAARLQMKNLNNKLHFEKADAAISPTYFQAGTFPDSFRPKIDVVHDGIDTDAIRPNPEAQINLHRNGGEVGVNLTRNEEIITFVNRNLEPMRGYHIFMRALPELLRRHPKAHIILVGGDGVSYGAKPSIEKYGAPSWKEVFLKEVRSSISDADWSRVHFVGQIPYPTFLSLLQVSRVHVYWTYPFVLSWSLIEAMSAGAAVVASDTAPVREVIEDGYNGSLVDFFSVDGLVDAVSALLMDEQRRHKYSTAARKIAVERYDLRRVCLPRQLCWVEKLAKLD